MGIHPRAVGAGLRVTKNYDNSDYYTVLGMKRTVGWAQEPWTKRQRGWRVGRLFGR